LFGFGAFTPTSTPTAGRPRGGLRLRVDRADCGVERGAPGRPGAAGPDERFRQRMPHDAHMRLLTPAWAVDLLAADIAHMHAGDGLNRFAVTEADVRGFFAAMNVSLTLYEDSANMATGNVANQLFTGQSAGDLENWPPTSGGVTNSRVISYARLDAGTLDLGVVRDSALNDTNDFEVFSESWEAVLPKVVDAYKVTSTVCESGAGSSDVAASGYCTAS
jgi:hypothetical protein